jgi:Domain of unknown function (DUF6471)
MLSPNHIQHYDRIMDANKVEREWAERAKRLLKAELKRADVTYEELAVRLSNMGLEETKASIASKLSRGAFPATFLLASLKAIGKETLNLVDM